MSTIDIRCPACAREVRAHDVNIGALIAKCEPCGRVFSFAPATMVLTSASERGVPEKPRSITVEGTMVEAPLVADYRSYGVRRHEPLQIRYRWFQPSSLFLVFFAFCWNAFLVFWYAAGIGGNAPWIMLVFPIVHVAVGFMVAHAALSSLFNTTRFDLDAERLLVTTGPIRWPWQRASVTVPIAELRQLAVVEKRLSEGNATYGLLAHRQNGTTLRLIEGLSDREIVRFVEVVLERQLGIPDEPWLST